MPKDNTMVIVRPLNCTFCGHGYHGLLHAVNYASQQGWNAIDLPAEQANQTPVFNALQQHDPTFFYGFGHGSPSIFTGDAEQEIFTAQNTNVLANRVVYLLSCQTGNLLGPAIIRNGAEAYAGFNVDWTWISEGGTEGDPYDDLYAKGFWESANELWNGIIDGETFDQAVQRSIDKYNGWIDYWIYENPQAQNSQSAITWLAHDRDGLVALHQGDIITADVPWLYVIPAVAAAILVYMALKK